ncbi:MAG: DUF2304 domain-containing protein [Clostridia bacterium]|nr:DUF2304 domain-containing protein [Clostridia bacterium]
MNYFFIIIAIIFIIYIFNMIKKKSFSVKESMFWVVGTFGILVFAIFPKLLDKIALRLHVEYPPSLLFLTGILFLLLINFRNTQKITEQNEKIIELAQRCSISEFEIEELKKGNSSDK